ncbi:unnamed protein product [Leuciscus chuanchicus]
MTSQKLIKPAKLKLDPKGKDLSPNIEKKIEAREMEQDYAVEVSVNADREKADVSNETILEAILKLESRVDEKLADLSEQSKQSSAMIASLTKAIQFNTEEEKDCKKRVKDLEIQNEHLRKDNCELKERVREQERYRMRWCLRIKGIEEKKYEDIRSHVIQILSKFAPEMEEAVDIVHRLGRRMDNKNRNVIVLFTQRRVKDEIWRRSKNSPICKAEGVRLAEMLPREDLEGRDASSRGSGRQRCFLERIWKAEMLPREDLEDRDASSRGSGRQTKAVASD